MILGSGWAGFKLVREMDKRKYQVVSVSPRYLKILSQNRYAHRNYRTLPFYRNHFVFTPLLASTSVGTLEFRCITEPVRGYASDVEYHQAWCDNVDFQKNKVSCTLNLPPVPSCSSSTPTLDLTFDHLIIAVGSYSNTFGIKGVKEHAFFLKEVSDARRIRSRVLECFERADMATTDEEKNSILHFAVVGGGPTGVEFSSELHDFVREDCSRLFPSLMNHVTIAVYDVAPTVSLCFNFHLSLLASSGFIDSWQFR